MGAGKILIIDDDAGIREFLQMFFEDREYITEIAFDGQDGVEKFEKNPSFDLVLCDMLMPRMIGINVLKKIKEMKPAQRVIMMTGVKEESMVSMAKSLGCHNYLTKPVKLAELEACVSECLGSSS